MTLDKYPRSGRKDYIPAQDPCLGRKQEASHQTPRSGGDGRPSGPVSVVFGALRHLRLCSDDCGQHPIRTASLPSSRI